MTVKSLYNPITSLHRKTGNHRRYLLMRNYISNIRKAALELNLFLSFFDLIVLVFFLNITYYLKNNLQAVLFQSDLAWAYHKLFEKMQVIDQCLATNEI